VKRLRIAYLTVNDPLDKRSWSGTTYYIGQTLQRNIGDVDFLGPVKYPWLVDKTLRAMAKAWRLIFRTEYLTKYSLLLSWYASKILERKMKGHEYDVVCAPAASTELSYFHTDLPVIYISDTTFKLISNYYNSDFKNASILSRWEANFVEKRSLQKSSLIIYPSHWAADSAMNDYNIAADKLFIMPLGANIDFTPPREMIFEKEKNTTLTLLYLAVEWERKGGAIAFEALKYLHEVCGIKAKLIVCGCVPPPQFEHDHMEVIPFLNKNKPEDQKRFVEILSSVHFLILPTRADCSLLVGCEANAYGVPVITTETGGVPDIVKDCINGYCLPYNADAKVYGNLIAEIFGDKEQYHKLIITSRQRFDEELNWDKWADSFAKIYESRIQKHIA